MKEYCTCKAEVQGKQANKQHARFLLAQAMYFPLVKQKKIASR
jgi:hypothetical protein